MNLERASRIEQRFIWMVMNYPLWRDFPPQPKWEQGNWQPKAAWQAKYGAKLVRAMKEDGIISKNTDAFCVPNIYEMMVAISDPTESQFDKFLTDETLSYIRYGSR